MASNSLTPTGEAYSEMAVGSLVPLSASTYSTLIASLLECPVKYDRLILASLRNAQLERNERLF